MPAPGEFPHLKLTFRGSFDPKFSGGPRITPEMKAIRERPGHHAGKLRGDLVSLRKTYEDIRLLRELEGLPKIPAAQGFLLRLPEGCDIGAISKSLGLELVAETVEGFVMVSTEDITLQKLEDALQHFELGEEGGGSVASVLDIYFKPDDERRIQSILSEEAFALWPLQDKREYIFDLGIQTATGTREVSWPTVKRRKTESNEEFEKRRRAAWLSAEIKADEIWMNEAEKRITELESLIGHYQGRLLSGMMHEPAKKIASGMVFPDSVEVRLQMTGEGFKDVIQNFAHLFEVSVPPEIAQPTPPEVAGLSAGQPVLTAPSDEAPAVCVIDSGIQEEHAWLHAAIDAPSSRCFLPGRSADEVADEFPPVGHGTRVAGAVLYPRDVPRAGQVEPVAWIKNARVLNEQNRLPLTLPPEKYLTEVVDHFGKEPRGARIFNHSITSFAPCPTRRMTAWATKIDQLSYARDVLFIQCAGNLFIGKGNPPNPGLLSHLENGKNHPTHLLEDSSRVANPAQSLHALTVGSVAHQVFDDADWKSFADAVHHPSAFTRSGYGMWATVKPEVVELGGDFVQSKSVPIAVRNHQDVGVELLNSTMSHQPAIGRDGAGTSFSAPKVTHIAAHLERLYPLASPQLYRALIVQSAQWPQWAAASTNFDQVLRLIGYGLPSLERAIANSPTRITLVTADAQEIGGKQMHIYSVAIPDEIRNAASEAKIKIEVTLAYSAQPRRTRARRTGYLETWLDWRSSGRGESLDDFIQRMKGDGQSSGALPWTIHQRKDLGQVAQTARDLGSVQKDWATVPAYDLPQNLAIAVRGHLGWNHRPEVGIARYCLVVSFEAVDIELPIYAQIAAAITVPVQRIGTH
jgi:hypothetical protein